jgi:hypothetical protein
MLVKNKLGGTLYQLTFPTKVSIGSLSFFRQKKSAARGFLSPPPVLISTVFCSLPN